MPMKRFAHVVLLAFLTWNSPASAGPRICESVANVILKSEGLADDLSHPKPGATVEVKAGKWVQSNFHLFRDSKRNVQVMVFEKDNAEHSSIVVQHGHRYYRSVDKNGVEDTHSAATKHLTLILDRQCRIARILSPDLNDTFALEQNDLRLTSFFCRELVTGAPLVSKDGKLRLEKIRDGYVTPGRAEEATAICRQYAEFLSSDPEPTPIVERPKPVEAPKKAEESCQNGDADDEEFDLEKLLEQLVAEPPAK